MKNIALALSFGLASSSSLADTGSISFHGQIDAGTCAIEIIDPDTGLPLSRVYMGSVNTAQFTHVDQEAVVRAFAMRLTPGAGCLLVPGANASVTFTGSYGGAGARGTLYALEPGGSTGLALSIKDDSGVPVAHGVPSKLYPLDDSRPTRMLFSAAYKAIALPVTAGQANTDIRFLVDIP